MREKTAEQQQNSLRAHRIITDINRFLFIEVFTNRCLHLSWNTSLPNVSYRSSLYYSLIETLMDTSSDEKSINDMKSTTKYL